MRLAHGLLVREVALERLVNAAIEVAVVTRSRDDVVYGLDDHLWASRAVGQVKVCVVVVGVKLSDVLRRRVFERVERLVVVAGDQHLAFRL
jgi:hypothetical protein